MLEGSFSDFTINVGSKNFRVHQVVLAARSPVFRAMFESPMLEAKRGEVTIDDVEVEVFELFLEFVYTGGIADRARFENEACKLIICASKYQLTDLEQELVNFLVSGLTPCKAANVLLIGDMLGNARLLNAAFTVADKDWKVIQRSDLWPKLIARHELATFLEVNIMSRIFKLKIFVGSRPVSNPNGDVSWSIGCFNFRKMIVGDYTHSANFTCPAVFGDGVEWKLRVVQISKYAVSIFLIYVGAADMPSYTSCYTRLYFQTPEDSLTEVATYDSGLISRVHLLVEKCQHLENFYNVPYDPYRSSPSFFLKLTFKKSKSSCFPTPLFDDIRELLGSQKYTDCNVIVGSEHFNVHKLIISLAFSMTINSDILDVDFVKPTTFQKMLDFVYKGVFDSRESSEIGDLLLAAYDLKLRENYFNHLRILVSWKLNSENIMTILEIACQKEDHVLKGYCLLFIQLHLDTLTSLPSWKLIAGPPSAHPELLELIFHGKHSR